MLAAALHDLALTPSLPQIRKQNAESRLNYFWHLLFIFINVVSKTLLRYYLLKVYLTFYVQLRIMYALMYLIRALFSIKAE